MADEKIALTGGIATGKSTVADRLRTLGAVILDADIYARSAVRPGTKSWQALRDWLGPDYFQPDSTLKRQKLRDEIIDNPSRRARLNALLHPFILASMWSDRLRAKTENPHAVVIFDIPLLFEGDFDKDFDTIILVYARAEVQVRRLMQRDGLDMPQALATLAIQYPIDSKRDRSHYIIDNSADLQETLRQTDELWARLNSRTPA